MKTLSIVAFLASAGVLFHGAADAKAGRELQTLGLKAYWSVLDDGQKVEAKGLAGRFLAETAPDRLAAEARVLKFRADVAAVLTADQRLTAGKALVRIVKMSKKEKWALLSKLLEGADRGALAADIEKMGSVTPGEQVALGVAVCDRMFDVLLSAWGEKLMLTPEQVVKVRALYAEMKVEMLPAAARLAEVRAAVKRDALALLRPEQKAKLDSFRDGVMAKVLAFIRGE